MNDIKDVDLYIFCNGHITPRNVDGDKNDIFKFKSFYRAIHRIIVGLNDTAKDKNGSDITISADGGIHALLKLKNIVSMKALLLLQIFERLGIIYPFMNCTAQWQKNY